MKTPNITENKIKIFVLFILCVCVSLFLFEKERNTCHAPNTEKIDMKTISPKPINFKSIFCLRVETFLRQRHFIVVFVVVQYEANITTASTVKIEFIARW